MKNIIKKNKKLHKFLLDTREILRIFYNTKTRSRFFWTLRNGDNTLSLNYKLNQESIVFDVGAYIGVFTEKIYNKHQCTVHAFEPLEEYCKILNKKFENKPKIIINNFGLLDRNEQVRLSNIGGASSVFSRKEGAVNTYVEMKSFAYYIEKESINKIDLLYINIEGSEYELLKEIIENGDIKKIKHLQIQFHNFVDGAKLLRKEIVSSLKKLISVNSTFLLYGKDGI